ncbi:hypothetical protein D3C71_2134820 [compost metagenome]
MARPLEARLWCMDSTPGNTGLPASATATWPAAGAAWAVLRAKPCSTALSSFCKVMGFSRKENAPMRVDSTAVSMVA